MTVREAGMPSARRWLVPVGLGLVAFYAAALNLFLAVRLLTGYRFWPVALFSNFLHIALLPSFALLPVLLLKRHWAGSAMLGLNVVAFGWLFGELFLPNQAEGCEGADQCPALSVMTLNLGSDLAEATPERIYQVVAESGADVVAFQEVNASHAAMIQADLFAAYPYQVIYSPGDGTLGIALISRYPVVEAEPFYLSISWLPYQRVTLDVDGRQMTVINVHPPPPGLSLDPRRMYFSRSLDDMVGLAALADNGAPTILLGDFNVTDQSEDYRILAASNLSDAYREAGFGFGLSYPANRLYGYTDTRTVPLVRIDYIWHTDHLAASRAWVGSDVGSDHLPMLAELVWR
jgi:vancomycin resistance protein VanJ